MKTEDKENETSKSTTATTTIKSIKSEKEQDLLKKIAYHEAYSTAYKLKLAKILAVKGAKAAGKAIAKGGKFVKGKYAESQENKKHKSKE